jgi:type IV secretory pathway ATPase VirB11/archaellum biosynthesis ATPase
VKLIKRAASGHGTLVALHLVSTRDMLARVVRAGLLMRFHMMRSRNVTQLVRRAVVLDMVIGYASRPKLIKNKPPNLIANHRNARGPLITNRVRVIGHVKTLNHNFS